MSDRDGFINASLKKVLDKVLEVTPLRHLSEETRVELREDVDVIRDVVARQRSPKIAVAGRTEVPLERVLDSLISAHLLGSIDVKEELGRGRWYTYDTDVGAEVKLLDARASDPTEVPVKAARRQSPDVVLLPWTYEQDPGEEGWSPTDVSAVERLLEETRREMTPGAPTPSVIVLLLPDRLPEDVSLSQAERVVRQQLLSSGIPGTDVEVVELAHTSEVARKIQQRLPAAARLQFSRVSTTSESRRRIAQTLIRASAGITGAIATIPLPVADMIPITTTQIVMIASIAHLGGRKFSLSSVGEFLVAAGLNVGAGYAARELVRALAQFVPMAGAAVSSGIAAGATLALGNAAAAYFLDGTTDAGELQVWK